MEISNELWTTYTYFLLNTCDIFSKYTSYIDFAKLSYYWYKTIWPDQNDLPIWGKKILNWIFVPVRHRLENKVKATGYTKKLPLSFDSLSQYLHVGDF